MTWLASGAALVASAASAQPPPSSSQVCPAIDEDYELCSGDPMSGNCPGFVAAAAALAELYASQLAEHPDWKESLDTTIWWGCGSANLAAIKTALAGVGTPRARALLESEPYRSVSQPRAPAFEPAGPTVVDCVNLAPSERDACAARELAAAQAEYARTLQHCQQVVAPGLRSDFIAAERAWNASKGIECEGAGDASQDPSVEGYARSTCAAQSTRQRTRSMLAAHPECKPRS